MPGASLERFTGQVCSLASTLAETHVSLPAIFIKSVRFLTLSVEGADVGNVLAYGLTNFGSIKLSIICIALSYCIFSILRNLLKYRADTEFGRQNGCRPVQFKIPFKWPLAVDIVKRGLQANSKKRLLALFSAFFDDLGPNVEANLLGDTGFVTMDPENIEAVLSSQFQGKSRNLALKAMLGDGIFTQDGAAWKHSRELLRRQFARMQYQNLQGFREHVENLVDILSTSRNHHELIDLQPYFFRFTLDTTTAMIFGQSVGSLKHEGRDSFLDTFNEASLITASRVRFGDLYWLYTPPGFSAACKAVKTHTDQFVKDALRQAQNSEAGTTMDRFAFITDLYKDHQDQRLVRDQLVNVLLAGRDSTASLMSYAFRLLVRHPEVLHKLRNEIDQVLEKERDVTRTHLQCVIKESLRLYPPAPINVRFCRRTMVLPRGGGLDGSFPTLIRSGMPVAYSVYHMQRRKDLYGPDAGIFRPERWQDSSLADVKWGYLPFNGGPRVCLGKDFAVMLASYRIARIIQAFPRIELPPGETWEEPGSERQQLTLVLSSADGCRVTLA